MSYNPTTGERDYSRIVASVAEGVPMVRKGTNTRFVADLEAMSINRVLKQTVWDIDLLYIRPL